ncbi:Pycsar system effector family protein, partial [Streptomyces europaeiscabiei]
MFVEMQRADTKATALCGAAGGLLAVGIAAISQASSSAWTLVVGLRLACILLGAAFWAALWVIRPVLPRGGSFEELAGLASWEEAEATGNVVDEMSCEEQLRLDACRLRDLAALARRKFRVARVAVD